MKETIMVTWITTQFEAFHRWVNAPDDVAFLRSFHRHLFHIKIGKRVNHNDRDIEFFQFKRLVEQHISNCYAEQMTDSSCEMIAQELLEVFDAYFVQVSEDGENGANIQLRS